MKKSLLISLIVLTALFVISRNAAAQENEPPAGPLYVVEEGDTLSSIALRFGVTVDDLVQANGLPNANTLFVGDRLVIPGLEGISGVLETTTVPLGESIRSLSRVYQIPTDLLARLNRLVSPAELHRGASLVLTRGGGLEEPYRLSLPAGETLLEAAVRSGTNPWAVAGWNTVPSPLQVVPGETVFISQPGDAGPMGLPGPITSIALNTLYQGEAGVLHMTIDQSLSLSGQLGPYTLAFVRAGEDHLYSLQGIGALLEPGMYPLHLTGTLADGSAFEFVQAVRIFPRDYIFEYITVPPELIDPETTAAETARIQPFLEVITPEKQWDGLFQAPSPFDDCINSTFGNRRSYNGSAFSFYHAGVDFCGGTGVNIFAPARGTVIFAGLLDVRGNFTLIDHGWGVYTAYMHQSEIMVETGQRVRPGDVIGLIGNTGRSTGPHLHWEIWVNGVAVNPLDWLVEVYP